LEFFRHCPQCGRRFHIVLVGKQLEHVEREVVKTPIRAAWRRGSFPVVEEGVTVVLDIEEFQYAYKCKHCGHEWSEKHTEKHVEKAREG
jgi:DNA-directed RNA polymerase subunit RPC12/RpoP